MDLLYIDHMLVEKQYKNEYFYFIINYLIGEKVYIHSNFGFYLYVMKNADKLSKKEFVDYFENYCIQTKGNSNNQIDSVINLIDRYLKSLKEMQTLKKKKRLEKYEIDILRLHNEIYEKFKSDLLRCCYEIIESQNLLQYIDLITEEKIELKFSLTNRENIINDEEVGEKIYNNLESKDKLFVLGNMIGDQMEMFCKNEIEEDTDDSQNDDIDLESIVLFTIPCSPLLNKENLIILRKQFHSKIDSLLQKVQELRLKIKDFELNDDLMNEIIEFGELIKEEKETLQNEIDKHIYIQNIKNSDPNYKNINVILHTIPPDILFMVYASVGAITFDKMLELKHRTSNISGKRKIELYISYEIDSEISE